MRLLATLPLLLVFVAAPAQARTPEEVVAEYVAATQQEGLTSVVRFMHPDELARFRAGVEPGIARALADRRTRAAFLSFADPRKPSTPRAFASDGEFLLAFISWMAGQNTHAPQLFKDATIIPLGHVMEGDLCHVVLRIRVNPNEPDTDQITHISTKLYNGEPMLALTPELERMMLPFEQHR